MGPPRTKARTDVILEIVAGTLSRIVALISVERNTTKKSHENKFQLFFCPPPPHTGWAKTVTEDSADMRTMDFEAIRKSMLSGVIELKKNL
jgi:hypothetical protein